MSLLRALLRVLAAAIALGALGVVVVRAATVRAPTALRRADPEERARIAARLASSEKSWQSRAKQTFPGDHWSQDDDFHNMEHHAARREATFAGVSVGDVLLGVDEGLRQNPADRDVSPVPCKPRPFYQ